jgi:hypothetical protein
MRHGNRTMWIVAAVVIAAVAVIGLRRQTRTPAPARIANLPPRFTDVTIAAELSFEHENGARGQRAMPEIMCGGAAWLDHDGDGRMDAYLVNGNLLGGDGEARNRLFRNLGDGKFEDVTDAAGVGDRGFGCGVAVGDYDNDGRSDLYVTNFGTNVLYHNEGDGKFQDVTTASGVAGEGWSTSAAFSDFDSDGFLDLYVCQYVVYDPEKTCSYLESGVDKDHVPTSLTAYCSPREFDGAPDRLYRNRGDGTFEDISDRAGVAVAGTDEGKSLGVVVFDHDLDGDQDIYVAADQAPNLLFSNRGDATFEEVGLIANVAYAIDGQAQAGMGVDAGDVDLDGDTDIIVTNFSNEWNTLYLNNGKGLFNDESRPRGLAESTFPLLGFGILLTDFDLDSDLDVFVGNGHVIDNVERIYSEMRFRQPDQLLENQDGRFVDISDGAGAWFHTRSLTRAAASCDYDGDGDEDLLVVDSGARAVLLRNETRGAHWIAFLLEGSQSCRDAYGATLVINFRDARGAAQRRFECRSARSYQSACDQRITIGLGRTEVRVDVVDIRWPSGIRQQLRDLEIDRVHRVQESE